MVIFHVSHLLYPSHSRGFSPQVALQSQLQTQHRGAMSKEEGIRRGSVEIRPSGNLEKSRKT